MNLERLKAPSTLHPCHHWPLAPGTERWRFGSRAVVDGSATGPDAMLQVGSSFTMRPSLLLM